MSKPKLNLEYLIIQNHLINLKAQVIDLIPNLTVGQKRFVKALLKEIIEKL